MKFLKSIFSKKPPPVVDESDIPITELRAIYRRKLPPASEAFREYPTGFRAILLDEFGLELASQEGEVSDKSRERAREYIAEGELLAKSIIDRTNKADELFRSFDPSDKNRAFILCEQVVREKATISKPYDLLRKKYIGLSESILVCYSFIGMVEELEKLCPERCKADDMNSRCIEYYKHLARLQKKKGNMTHDITTHILW